MGNFWDSDGSVSVFTNKGSIDFVLFSRETVIDIEPVTINIGMFELEFFTVVRVLSS
jgi:hypothetical protein